MKDFSVENSHNIIRLFAKNPYLIILNIYLKSIPIKDGCDLSLGTTPYISYNPIKFSYLATFLFVFEYTILEVIFIYQKLGDIS